MAPATLEPTAKAVVGLLINPLSGRNRKSGSAIATMTGNYPDFVQHRVQTPLEVYDALIDCSRKKVNILVISGGDGTVQAVLSVLFTHQPFVSPPLLVVLEGGTTNMIAGDVGVVGNQYRALSRLRQWVQTGDGNVTRLLRPVLRLQVPGHEVKYGMFFGAAGISRGVSYYQDNLHNKKLTGLPGICMTIGRFLWGIIRQQKQFSTATRMGVRLDKQPLVEDDFLLVLVTTLERLFFGLRPFWGTETGPLRFSAVRTQAPYFIRLLPFLTRGRRADKGTRENGYYSHNIRELELYLTESVALDGELYKPESAEQPTLLQYGGDAVFLQV